MSTETQAQQGTQAQAAEQPSQLDAVIEATQKRQGIVDNASAIMGCEPAKLLDLLRNVWHTSKGQPDLTPQEMFVGISLVARYGLDPIAREVYVTRSKKGLMTIVGIDGWIKILCRTPHYDGHEVEIHEDEDGKIDWVETRIHSKERTHPATYKAFMSEYIKMGGFVAQQMPSHMLRLFSLRHAARQFVPLAGVTTEEEARWMTADKPSIATAQSLEDFVGAKDPTNEPTNEPAPANPPTAQPKEAEHTDEPDPPADRDHDDVDPDQRMDDFDAAYDMAKTLEELDRIDRSAKTDPKIGDRPRQNTIFGGKGWSQQARDRIEGEA